MSETWDEAVERAMASAPPGTPTHEVMTDVHRLVDERDALKRQVEELKAAHAVFMAQWTREVAEATELRAQLAKAKAQATEAEATVDRMRWEARGAPQFGEEETAELCPHGRPAFLPCPGCEHDRGAA